MLHLRYEYLKRAMRGEGKNTPGQYMLAAGLTGEEAQYTAVLSIPSSLNVHIFCSHRGLYAGTDKSRLGRENKNVLASKYREVYVCIFPGMLVCKCVSLLSIMRA